MVNDVQRSITSSAMIYEKSTPAFGVLFLILFRMVTQCFNSRLVYAITLWS